MNSENTTNISVTANPTTTNSISCVVLDIGTYLIKIGYGGEDLPRSILPCKIGIPSQKSENIDLDGMNNILFPLRPWEKRDNIEILSPYEYDPENRSIKMNEDYLIKMIQEASFPCKPISNSNKSSYSACSVFQYGTLDDKITNNPLILPVPSNSENSFLTKMTEIAFEQLESSMFFTCKRPVLSCYACGKTSGICVDIGASNSNVCCVQDGYCFPSTIQEYPIAGDFLDSEILKKLQKSNYIIPEYGVIKDKEDKPYLIPLLNIDESYLDWSISYAIREIKHTSCCFNLSDSNTSTFTLPDGNTIDISSIRTSIPNIIFKPNNSNYGYPGIVQMIANSISDLVQNTKDTSNVTSSLILTGGTSLLNGFDSKLFQALADHKYTAFMQEDGLPPKIIASPRSIERQSAAWIGASILSSLGTFPQLAISRKDYQEFGSSITLKRCP
ncbi:actin family protein [Cryptosporidium andersoni]|uniref:Actin family protein n=1 Tax=Cryptosporidium andersoni TaxID=117008 RepID=A0A1J4ME70_9CRYT|nr:actin family protein [Cryptosporidium andersoni]